MMSYLPVNYIEVAKKIGDRVNVKGMIMETEKIQFQTTEEAKAVKETHLKELQALSSKYNMTVQELFVAASNDQIDNQEDLFLIFKRSYLLANQ